MSNQTMTEEERLNELKLLKASYDMYERAKKDTMNKRKETKNKEGKQTYSEKDNKKTMELMDTMQKDIITKYEMLGGDLEELKKDIGNEDGRYGTYTANSENLLEESTDKNNSPTLIGDGVMDYLSKIQSTFEIKEEPKKTFKKEDFFDTKKIKEQFDSIPLPSKGECYANKMSKVPVAYLTAYDENIIVSPNLYKDGSFLEYLLKAKILNPSVDSDDLLPGDRDAIILWLRATGYGNEFPVTVTDNETGKEFDTNIDLSKIEYKDFDLKGDENGWFKYTLPISKDEIKFSFLTYKQIKMLNKMEEDENISIKREELKAVSDKIMRFKREDLSNTINKQFGRRIDEAIKTLDEWYDMIEVDNIARISHSLTNRLIMTIKEINGITDKNFISEYVTKMNIRDSAALRKYITENEPGLNFEIEVERPKSLGGGSMKTFLNFDQFIFLNIA